MRATESNATLPTVIGDLTYELRFVPGLLGGEMRLGLDANARYRSSDDPTDGIGRDVSRITADMLWQRNWSLAYGVQAQMLGGLSIDAFRTRQDDTFAGDVAEIVPQTAVTLRWPLVKSTAGGVTQILEPVAMVGWTGGTRRDIPNDESTRVEFDEGNLLSLSRFPAPDRRERGVTAAYGVNWMRSAPGGLETSLSAGQVWRDIADNDFSDSSGLTGQTSDLLLAGQIKNPFGLSLGARSLFDEDLNVAKAEARLGLTRRDLSVGASYIWLDSDPDEERYDAQSEWSIDGSYSFARHWTGSANMRYDVARDRATNAGLGLRYQNECVNVNLSLSRRFTSSDILQPSTDIGFTIGIRGFGLSGADSRYTRTCRN